jgi:SAM-dependent methyltransferase
MQAINRMIDKRGNTMSKCTVTGRGYEDLKKLYLIDERRYLRPSTTWLSVGEGLSDYASKTRKKSGVVFVAIDPIYKIGSKILQKDPEKVKTAVKETLGEVLYADNSENPIVKSPDGTPHKTKREFPLSEPDWLVAGNGFNLPFKGKSFDFIVSSFLLEHSNYQKLLPELLRVLKNDGEIRSYGCRFNIFTDRKIAIASKEFKVERINKFEYQGYWSPIPGFPSTFNLTKIKGFRSVNSYLVIDEYPGNREKRFHPDLRIARMIVHRKDDKRPTFSNLREDILVARIIPNSRHRDDQNNYWDSERKRLRYPYAYRIENE